VNENVAVGVRGGGSGAKHKRLASEMRVAVTVSLPHCCQAEGSAHPQCKQIVLSGRPRDWAGTAISHKRAKHEVQCIGNDVLSLPLAGKAPIVDADDTALLAAQESTVQAASAAAGGSSSSGSNKTGLLPKLGQWLGFGTSQSSTTAAAAAAGGGLSDGVLGGSGGLAGGASVRQLPSHVWQPVFHPSRTQAGTQPTLVIPQVRPDACWWPLSCEHIMCCSGNDK
jgi:hypothetical protein